MTLAGTRATHVEQKALRIPGDRLQGVLDQLVGRKGFQHATLAVQTADSSVNWSGAAGSAYTDGTPMTPDIPYFIASVDKLYTATAILKLYEEGRLSLGAPLSAYLPTELTDRIHVMSGVDRSNQITVGHLLGHTSGLADYLEDRPRAGRSLIERLIQGGDDITLSAQSAMGTVRDQLAPHFPPQDPMSERSKVRYSDTNYLLLIAIIEALYKQPLHEVVHRLVFAPSGMSHTYFLGVSEPLASTPKPATLWAGDQAIDLPQVLVSLRSIYSTVDDQIASLRALLGGELFDQPDTVGLMQRHWKRFGLPLDMAALRAPSSPIEYGSGMMRFALPRLYTPFRPIPPVVGHTGSTGSWLFFCPHYELLFSGTVDEASAGAVPFRVVVPRVLRAIEDANPGW
ncbi:MAG: serine hydrolase domain-containing protein [Desulfobacterales bacterium]|nr:serine hydrolase domain-containing protein [Desulfobacterales bacterium]